MLSSTRPFRLAKEHRVIFGVCAGIAYKFAIPVDIVRIVVFFTVLLYWLDLFKSNFVLGFFVFMAYLLLFIFAKSWEIDPEDFNSVTQFKTKTCKEATEGN